MDSALVMRVTAPRWTFTATCMSPDLPHHPISRQRTRFRRITAGALIGQGNAFVTKFDPAGTALIYSTYLGGSGGNSSGDQGNGIAVDAHGNAYVVGTTGTPNFPTKTPFRIT
jgi:Beta-propeller repeat